MSGMPVAEEHHEKVDRQVICPFLVRVFINDNQHLTAADFANPDDLPEGALHIHTWKNATLQEIVQLVSQVRHELRNPKYNYRVSFAFVYPDSTGKNVVRDCEADVFTQRKDPNNRKTLGELGFDIGDHLDVALTRIDDTDIGPGPLNPNFNRGFDRPGDRPENDDERNGGPNSPRGGPTPPRSSRRRDREVDEERPRSGRSDEPKRERDRRQSGGG